jgi:hypothetical protein
MDWEKLDWSILDRLREGFLTGTAAQGPYWRTSHDLEHYDLTYAERIGWKWDAVLNEVRRRGWAPPPRVPAGESTEASAAAVHPPQADPLSSAPVEQVAPAHGSPKGWRLVDWGCGSGVAGRRVIEAFGPERFEALYVHDHSSLAREYAALSAKRKFPHLHVGELRPDTPIDLLVISHVLNELSAESRKDLLATIERATSVIWVEPGTHAVSRDLIGVREQLRQSFRVIAPCTHRERCGLLAAENSGHWCHYFASPPPAIYADSDWVKFGQRAGIDLRSLPYSFLVLEREGVRAAAENATDTELARIIGEPRHYKGYAKLLSCSAAGVQDLTLQKRDAPDLFKALKRETGVPVYRWRREGDRIKEARHEFPDA